MSATEVVGQPLSPMPIARSSNRNRASAREIDAKISTAPVPFPNPELVDGLTPTRSSQHASMQLFDGIVEMGPIASAGPGAQAMTTAMRRKEQAYFLAMCFPLFLAGWNELSSRLAFKCL